LPVKEIASIERELFGPNPAYDSPLFATWRAQLRDAFAAKRATDGRKLRSAALADDLRVVVGEMPHRLPIFIGRDWELDRVQAILTNKGPDLTSTPVARAALHGLPGIGKTALAVEYAHRNRHFYAGICWLSAETNSGILAGLAALAAALHVATPARADMQASAKAAIERIEGQKTGWLLIYDDAKSPKAITDLVPRSGADVLITSRFHDWAEFAEEIPVDLMPPNDAINLLQRRSGLTDEEGAKTLALVLDHLPLALDHAAALSRLRGINFLDYTVRVSELITIDPPIGVSYPRSVRATFTLAIQAARERSPFAEALISYLGFCSPDPVPQALVEGASDDQRERTTALDALVELSLVSYEPSGAQTVRIHRLVQEIARTYAMQLHIDDEAVSRLLYRLVEIFPQNVRCNPNSSLCAQLTPHILALREVVTMGRSSAVTWMVLLVSASSCFEARALFEKAEVILRDVLQLSEEVFGPESPDTATVLDNIAGALANADKFQDALPLCERALAIRKSWLGPDHPITATSLSNLGHILYGLNKFTAARKYCKRALAIVERHYGATHVKTAAQFNDLAVILTAQGETIAAKRLYDRALRIYRLQPQRSAGLAMCLKNVAKTYQLLREFQKAKRFYKEAIEIYVKLFGQDSAQAAYARAHLSEMLIEAGTPGQALSLGDSALNVLNSAVGPIHPWTRFAAAIVVEALDALGRGEKAEILRIQYSIPRNNESV